MNGIFSILLVVPCFLFLGCTSVKVAVPLLGENIGRNPQNSQDLKAPIVSANLPKVPRPPIKARGPNGPFPSPPTCPAKAEVNVMAKKTAQETDVWCWAASAQMVMNAHGTNVKQCSILNVVQNRVGQESTSGGTFCCGDNNGKFPGVCHKSGWPHQAFNRYGYNWQFTDGPMSPEEVKGQLCQTGPFIYVLLFEKGGGHSFVVKDYKERNGKLFLLVHDHRWIEGTSPRKPIPIYEISYEEFKNGEWELFTYKHELNYVQIMPL